MTRQSLWTLFGCFVLLKLINGGISLAQGNGTPPNIVVILTDDQRWDTLWAMPIVQDTLIRRGVNFTQAFVSTPLCCPFRASFLGGGYYAHNTGVLTNTLPNGGAQRFVDTNTLPLRLQQHGYATALVGKYLNGYPLLAPYIPPGWNRFVTQYQGSWAKFRVVIGSSTDLPSTGSMESKTQYLTDYLRDEALTFLDSVGNRPFFLYFAPSAPHTPALPAPGDEGLFSSYLYRSRGYGEVDLSDKPVHIRNSLPLDAAIEDEFYRQQLRSLQAVDRTVGALIDKLQTLGKLDNTVIVYTSDNGYLWGEHGLRAKRQPYDESIRVPLIVVAPGVAPREDASLVVSNLDVPTTIWHLAGLPTVTDGLNLLLLLHDSHLPWRPEGIFLEHFMFDHAPRSHTIWAGWRTKNYKYVEHATGEKELYDLVRDSYELENVVTQTQYSSLIKTLARRTATRKGLAITTAALPTGERDKGYFFPITAWGGTVPYTWSILRGSLPAGLTLEPDSGVIYGIPASSGTQQVDISVQDSSIATQSQTLQRFVRSFSLVIGEPGLAYEDLLVKEEYAVFLHADEDEDINSSPFVSPVCEQEVLF